MFGKTFITILTSISLVWIFFGAYQLIDDKHTLSPERVFGVEDSVVLAVNRYPEIKWGELSPKFTPKILELSAKLLQVISDEQTTFLSAKRDHFLIETRSNWSLSRLEQVFQKCHLALIHDGLNQYRYKDLIIDFEDNYLYFHADNLETTPSQGWLNFDIKSSASKITISSKETEVTDIYFNHGKAVEYISKNKTGLKGRQVNDRELFCSALPANLSDYHFYEKEYACSIDPIFRNSVLNDFMQTGFVEISSDSVHVLITDYKENQDPIAVFNEATHQPAGEAESGSFSGLKLTNEFRDTSNFYVYTFNGFAYISYSKSTCESIIAELKLGKTLLENESRMQELFSDLPQRVSERIINASLKRSVSIYKNRVFESKLTYEGKNTQLIDEIPTVSIHTNGLIVDFISYPGERNLMVLNENGILTSYEKGTLKWKKTLKGKLIGAAKRIKNSDYVVFTLSSSIHVINKAGNYLFGGPIDISSAQAAHPATYFNYKGQDLLVYPTRTNEIMRINAAGQRTSVLTLKDVKSIDAPIETWLSQNRLFLGAKDKSTFIMIDADKRIEHRRFDLKNDHVIGMSQSNELFLFGISNGMFAYTTQKGEINPLKPSKGTLMKTTDDQGNEFLIVQTGKQLEIFNALGGPLGKFEIPFDNIESAYITRIGDVYLLSLVDGIENNVYLFGIKGRQLIKQKIKGSKKTTITEHGNLLVLSTEMEDYLVQYLIKL